MAPADFAFVPESPVKTVPRELNRQLQFLSENFPDGVVYQYTVTAEGRRLLTYLGRGAERIFGERPPHIPVEVEWLTARILPEDEPGIARAGEESRRDLTQFNHDVRIRARDGSERWVSFRTQPRELSDGSVVWDGVILDITAKRRADESMRRQVGFLEQLNQTTLELLERRNVNELLPALVNRASTLLHSHHTEIFLLEGAELVIRPRSNGRETLPEKRIGRDTPTPAWQAIDSRTAVVTERSAGAVETRETSRPHGFYATATFPIVHGTKCVGVLAVARNVPGARYTTDDIHEGMLFVQMAASVLHNAAVYVETVLDADRTMALRESEQRFRGVFDQNPVAIVLLSVPDGRIVELNHAALAAFGFTREEALGRTSQELGLWVDSTLRERYLQPFRAEGAVPAFEAGFRRKNGQTFTVRCSGSLITIGRQPFSLISLQAIPATGQEQPSPAASPNGAPPVVNAIDIPRGNGERVLVVDDDAVCGFAVEKLIESLGYSVSRCMRPEDALARFAAAPSIFDLVVTDLAMPGMDGQELIKHLTQIRPDVPIVVVSGYVDAILQDVLEHTGVRFVLRKPVTRAELGKAVARCVRESR